MMYRVALVTLLAMLAAGSGAGSIRDPEALVVHEWGTFTSIAGENGEALAWTPQLGSDDLPCFVERFRRYRGKGFVRGTVRMETPVLYFYAPRETSVNVSVGFPGGLITEWFPRADVSPAEPVADDGLARPGFMGRAKWTGVRVLPGSREDFPTQGRSSHYYLARQTDAAPVEVGGAREKFLFYRGVADIRVPITASPDAGGSVRVSSRNGAPLGTVILFERRGDRTGFEMRSSAGATVTFPRPPLTSTVEELTAALEASLVRSGLYAREAKAMVNTWRDSWFEEGTRVFYVLARGGRRRDAAARDRAAAGERGAGVRGPDGGHHAGDESRRRSRARRPRCRQAAAVWPVPAADFRADPRRSGRPARSHHDHARSSTARSRRRPAVRPVSEGENGEP